jgi:hypothetical protein
MTAGRLGLPYGAWADRFVRAVNVQRVAGAERWARRGDKIELDVVELQSQKGETHEQGKHY